MKSYACVAATKGGARCRNFVTLEDFTADLPLCPFHQKRGKVKVAPPPEVVICKFNINHAKSMKMVALGVPIITPEFQIKERVHLKQAESIRRDPYRFREQTPDSGVPVFGREGLQNVSLYQLLRELIKRYAGLDIYIQPKRDNSRWMSVLVLRFSNQSENQNTATTAVNELLEFIAASHWGFVHVWANPPQKDGRVVHTVNSAHRRFGAPEWALQFNNGLWWVAKRVDKRVDN